MRAILVEDELIMQRSFVRCSRDIKELELVSMFQNAAEAIAFAQENEFELAVLDVRLPGMDGIELAVKLREINPKLLVVFISAYDEYVRDSNLIGGDYYIVKPYKKETIEMMVEKMLLLSGRFKKDITIEMFGIFNVIKNGKVVKLTGKAKEILALVATRRGKEISNEEIYSTVWEGRPKTNENMKVYYNALRRLKDALSDNGISDLLISTTRGQMLNASICECDYFKWLDTKSSDRPAFANEFLSEYSWGEYFKKDFLNLE